MTRLIPLTSACHACHMRHPQKFENFERPDAFFTPAQRSVLVRHILLNTKYGETEHKVPLLRAQREVERGREREVERERERSREREREVERERERENGEQSVSM